ncbi:tripartite tricarboxylate transporter substrate-binding protein [Falsiroseomonas stagni]|uniref:Tripartite-type tricarboxylate transporter, receptor component TctC n=1 Tax=Falsiroseomonas stagni DSM 19981 TaxID=1123062 RepID=A0A1I4DRK5_9PROT|nr:tripartite tricarboxylate transporter substrate-binding protein [Falsiroseomonas stagni]SFK94676.1 Tripartite-type tricarboxylate transporter, receptor component TctC [Falsiroseomonas stagni DSM 19981]
MLSLTRQALLGLGLAAAFVQASAAQVAFPQRPVTMIVGFAAGGPSDVVARLVAAPMGADLGQPVVVENIPGAGGTIGHARLLQARPDGHVIMLGGLGQATVPTLYRRLPFDPVGSVKPIGLINEVPMTIVARRTFPASSLAEFVAVARREGERLNIGNAGVGSTSHLCGLLLMSALGTPMTTVPYRGSALVLNDLVSGTLDVGCDQTTNTAEQIRSGTIRALAVSTAERVAALPDLPTAAEAGLAEMRMSGWTMLYAHAGTPQPVLERLNRALLAALRDEGLVRRFADLGTAPVAADRATPEAGRAFWDAEIARWRPLILASNQFAD